MIYFVDEDIRQLRPFKTDLEMRGFEVTILPTADQAFEVLVNNESIELVILDIMLAATTITKSRYDSDTTKDFLTTGLVLLDDLILHDKQNFPRKVALFSMATGNNIVSEIRATAKKHKIEYLRKKEYLSSYKFGEKIEKIINNMSGV